MSVAFHLPPKKHLAPLAVLALCGVRAATPALASEPRVLVDGCQLEQIAAEPDIVTPVGCAFDPQGRLLVVESHTHQRPEDYDGPAGDRIRMLSDSDGDGQLDAWSTFAEGFQQAMNVAVAEEGDVYVVTRRDVHLLRDTDGDGVADSDETIVRLETEAEYPHNGLAGIWIIPRNPNLKDPKVELYLGLGENFGFPYRLVGSDGNALSGRGGVGAIFYCRRDGSQLTRMASGFWNPFSICVAPHNRLFAVDNDPDASPPCRLLHVVYSGDYGHRWEYGRAGVHPLQAWDGELPGTLPMVCGTGEAPTAIVAHRGWLWVTSWGEHRIERYRLTPRGASFGAERDVVVQGDADFRPTGMAVGPNGALWFSDWVDRSYPVHGTGRIWRLSLSPNQAITPTLGTPTAHLLEEFARLMSSDREMDPFALYRGPPWTLTSTMSVDNEAGDAEHWDMLGLNEKLALLHNVRMIRQHQLPYAGAHWSPLIRRALGDEDAAVRLYGVRWSAEEKLSDLRDNVAALLDGPIPNERYFLAVLGAIDWLDGDGSPRHSGISDGLLARELRNRRRSPELHALALRLISPDYKQITMETLREYLASPSAELQTEVVRTLASRTNSDRFALLAEIADDDARDAKLRAIAITGLAADASQHVELLSRLAEDDVAVVAKEARRVLRMAGLRSPPAERKPPADDLNAWNELLAGGDPDSGRWLFFTPAAANCATCHKHGGRGGEVGPDLTRIGNQQSRERIVASILQPSREIAPRYQAWVLATDDGRTHLGLRLPQGGDDGQENYADANGRTFTLASETIDQRTPADVSIMPAGLEQSMTVDDLRDLVAFLAGDEDRSVDPPGDGAPETNLP